MFRILVIDDDVILSQRLGSQLQKHDFSVTLVHTQAAALETIEQKFDAIICDYELSPTETGTELVKQMRNYGVTTPVLILTAKDLDTITPWEALDCGCDDFLRKPYIIEEIVSRLHALIRRSSAHTTVAQVLQFEGISMDVNARQVLVDGLEIRIGKILFLLLYRFLQNPHHAQSVEQLIEYLWGENALFDDQSAKALRVHIHHLKSAIKPYGSCIKNVYGYGYELVNMPK